MRLPQPTPQFLAPLVQRDVLVNGTRIAYTEAGEGEPVVILHGAIFCGNPFNWELQAAMAPRYKTYAPDYPGWGASEKPAGVYDLEEYRRFFIGFLDALGLERVQLVGHSLGGLLGSAFALLHPERVRSLTTIAVPPAWVEFGMPSLFQPFMLPMVGEALLAVSPWVGPDNPVGIRRYYDALFHDPAGIDRTRMRPVLQACLEATADPAHQAAFLKTMRGAHQAALGPWRERFRGLLDPAPFPMLLMAGRQDPMFPVALIEDGARRFPGARLEVLDRCGHFPTWEQPERVAALIEEFFSAQAART